MQCSTPRTGSGSWDSRGLGITGERHRDRYRCKPSRTKAYPDLLAAARTVIDQVPNVRFVAVGQGPQADELRALHAQLGLGPRFQFTGYRPDAVRVMSAFDIFCLASHHEGLPIAMLEALTLGLPIVATDVGGIRELIGDGSDAVLVQPRRPDELAKASSDS
jgi:glycosyltransferase involved in cell wall biosynthesis